MIANVIIVGRALKSIAIEPSYDEREFGYRFEVETKHVYADSLEPRKAMHNIYCIPKNHWERVISEIKPNSQVYIQGALEYKRGDYSQQTMEAYILVHPFGGNIKIIK